MNTLQTNKNGGFSASFLKLIACIFMTIDHMGAYLFPRIIWFRIAGRIAYPVFAYFIAEGCAYTRNKMKRFLLLLIPGILFDIVYFIVFKEQYGNIFLTFSLSVISIYTLQWAKKELASKSAFKALFSAIVFIAFIGAVWAINRVYHVEYGFYGVLVPVFASMFEGGDKKDVRLLSFSAGLILLALKMGIANIQIWSLMAVPLLALYNGEAGVKKFKYGFYIFYPLHLILIWLAGFILQYV